MLMPQVGEVADAALAVCTLPCLDVTAVCVLCSCVQLSDRQLDEVTVVCNRYPDISVATELPEGPDVAAGARLWQRLATQTNAC
jgi:hypothetical protein